MPLHSPRHRRENMQLKCAGYGTAVTSSNKVKSVAVIRGGALRLTSLWSREER